MENKYPIIEIDTKANWGPYWGYGPMIGLDALGVIRYADRKCIGTGALLQNWIGDFFMGNGGRIQPLPTREIAKALISSEYDNSTLAAIRKETDNG